MALFDRELLLSALGQMGGTEWAEELRKRCSDEFSTERHGTLPLWLNAFDELPHLNRADFDASGSAVSVLQNDSTTGFNEEVRDQLADTLMKFHPWRKGPFQILGIDIDTEWRSDLKWNRLAPHVDFGGRSVLDVGCGNGYYLWKMIAAGARIAVGLDPFLLYVMQFEVLKHFVKTTNEGFAELCGVLPAGDDALRKNLRLFDITFSMGVLYHQISPIEHLQRLAGSLKPGGQLILETLIIDGNDDRVLIPDSRYAKMRNVWFIPTIPVILQWLKRTGFRNCEVLDVSRTTLSEQRRTEWMTFESLEDFLDPLDSARTIEGYSAPVRALISATAGG
ncbi:MAG: tRNA 5-methoxyuridine(34)/uridine 5-oxyacetic acid(34) synthase CmoB [Planctomyces sp.]